MLIKLLKPDFQFLDTRGELYQLVHEGYNQFNIIFSHKDVLRGNHYHKINTEAFFVISGKIQLQVSKDGISEEYLFQKGEMFQIPPYVMHSFYYEEDTLLASMYDIGVELDDGGKDIYE